MKNKSTLLISWLTLILFVSLTAFSQTPVFTYQGKLSDTGTPPTGTYQMEFRLFDAVSGGTQINGINGVVTNNAVAVTGGVFTVNLDFGTPAFPGADRFLQISVRRNAGESFVTLSPRQQIASSPYSIRTLSAAQADTALDSNGLGGVPASQYLQTTGNGSTLTNLNASSVTTGTLSNGRLGQIPTANIADSAVTAAKIATGEVVKGVTVGGTTLTDNVTLAPGANITITPSGNTLTIASNGGGGGVGGSGTPNTIPVWSSNNTLADSTQSAGAVQLPPFVSLAATGSGNSVTFGSPNGETGMTISGAVGRADVRFDGTTLRLAAGAAGGPPGNGIGVTSTAVQLPNRVELAAGAQGNAITLGSPNSETGISISGTGGRADLRFDGTLKLLNGPGGIPAVTSGIAITTAGNVGVGTITPSAKLEVRGSLAITNGGIRVTGAGVSTPTPAFIHVKTAANQCGGQATIIDNPHSNNDPNAILIVTSNVGTVDPNATVFLSGIFLRYGDQNIGCSVLGGLNRWMIYTSGDPIPNGARFNVLVIKP